MKIIINLKKTFFLMFSIILLATCCKKEPKPKEERRYGPSYFGKYADYLMFKPGSTWIYENNKTGELDTCELWAIERDTITNFYDDRDFKVWYTFEKINFDIKSSQKKRYSPTSGGIISYRTAIPCLDCGRADTTVKAVLKKGTYSNVLYAPYTYASPGSAYYPNYTIGSETFNEVYRFDLQNDGSIPFWNHNLFNLTPRYDASYYWAKDIGLISIKVIGGNNVTQNLDSMYWNLKTYNIQKF